MATLGEGLKLKYRGLAVFSLGQRTLTPAFFKDATALLKEVLYTEFISNQRGIP